MVSLELKTFSFNLSSFWRWQTFNEKIYNFIYDDVLLCRWIIKKKKKKGKRCDRKKILLPSNYNSGKGGKNAYNMNVRLGTTYFQKQISYRLEFILNINFQVLTTCLKMIIRITNIIRRRRKGCDFKIKLADNCWRSILHGVIFRRRYIKFYKGT